MSCQRCYTEFGMFSREHGCEVCGFAFCGKCCNKNTIISEAGEKKKQMLCDECLGNLTRGKPAKSIHSASPPSAIEKRLAFGKHSFSLDVHPGASSSSGFSEKDKEIAERLQKLKRERNKELLPSQMEIEERLAKLKGMDPSKYTAPPIMVYRPADKRSVVEQADDLIKQMESEVKIDSSIRNPEDKIAVRLARLKGVYPLPEESLPKRKIQEISNAEPQESTSINEITDDLEKMWHESEKNAAKNIQELSEDKELQKYLKDIKKKEKDEMQNEEADEIEAANILIEKLLSADTNIEDPETLDSSSDTGEKSEEMDENAPEEFPWCVICTEDAKIKCFGCSGDLYCMKCFRDCHDSLDIKDHKTCSFLLPKM